MSKEKKQKNDWRNGKRNIGGSIKTIGNRIYARIQYNDEITGKRKEKLRRADNRTDARKLIKKMRDELEDGGQTALNSDKLTFSEVAELYEKTKLIPPVFQNGIKVTGIRSYDKQKSLIKPLKKYFGRKAIRNIKPSDLEAYKAERLHTPVVIKKKVKNANPVKARRKFIYEKVNTTRRRSVASVNRELSLLRQIFGFALSEDFLLRNPFARAKKIISTAAEVQRERVLSFDEETALLTACENENRKHIKPIIITALDTAMRKGELLKLQWKDIDLIKNIITVQATNTKTEKTRMIGMTLRVKKELERLWEVSPKDESILVFGIESNFNRAWRSALKKAGLQDSDLHFHDLRHTAITRMIRANVPASEAMKISGHSEMKTFQRYVNLTNDSVTNSANLLDSFNNKQTEIQSDTASEMVN
ncbi:MAG: site-specific integrase [Acidobacteriota bacterium]|nr:site-specific integrase [Acidobacteriota bacterium]